MEQENNGSVNQAVPNNNDEAIQKLVADQVEKQLAKIKQSLNNSYKERDQARNELNSYKNKNKIQELEEAGNKAGVLEEKLRLQSERLSELEAHNTKLSRDTLINNKLSGLEFANPKAMSVVAKEISSSIQQDSSGDWLGMNGESVDDLVKSYINDKNNSFLFKPKISKGSSNIHLTSSSKVTSNNKSSNRITDMSYEEAMSKISNGEFKDDGKTYWTR